MSPPILPPEPRWPWRKLRYADKGPRQAICRSRITCRGVWTARRESCHPQGRAGSKGTASRYVYYYIRWRLKLEGETVSICKHCLRAGSLGDTSVTLKRIAPLIELSPTKSPEHTAPSTRRLSLNPTHGGRSGNEIALVRGAGPAGMRGRQQQGYPCSSADREGWRSFCPGAPGTPA